VTPARRILLPLLAAAAFLPLLGRRDVVTSHEARVVQTARAMAHSGWPWNATPATVPAVKLSRGGHTGQMIILQADPDAPPRSVNPWLVPVLNDQIRLQKPPLPYWVVAATFRLFADDWSPALARLPGAVMGALATLLIHDLAKRLLGRRAALPAALVWTSAYFLPDEFRKAMADPHLAFFALAATWGWIRGTRLSLLTFYAATALGLLAKGPPLLIHLAIPIALYHLLHRRRTKPPLSLHLIGLAILLLITLPWPLYVLATLPDARPIWVAESVGKLTEELEPGRPALYYLPLLFQLPLPWTPLWMTALALPFLRRRGRPFRIHPSAFSISPLPLLWLLAITLIFSLAHMKKAAYLLPAMPAFALMTAQAITTLTALARRHGPRSPAAVLLGAQTLIPLGFAVALPFLIPKTEPLAVRLVAPLIPIALCPLALRHLARRRATDWLTACATATVIVTFAFLNFVQTPKENARSPRTACRFIRLALENDPDTTVLPEKLPPEATLYLPADLPPRPAARTILYLLDDRNNEARTDRDAFAQRLPTRTVTAVAPVPLPTAEKRPRYKLFRVTVTPGAPKTLAGTTPPPP
jgi:4-amino-4-deoxy-L-arabinose transferase-like glycosyltransferase